MLNLNNLTQPFTGFISSIIIKFNQICNPAPPSNPPPPDNTFSPVYNVALAFSGRLPSNKTMGSCNKKGTPPGK
jgi:hypothetical protein